MWGSNAFEKLGYSVPNVIFNSSVPLHFERFGTATPEPNKYYNLHKKLQDEYEFALTNDISMEGAMAKETKFRTNAHKKAHCKALEGYRYLSTNPEQAIIIARQTLDIQPTPDAYSILAIACSKNYEEALEYYRKGAELGPDMSNEFDYYVKKREVFSLHALRGYFRCLHGEANTLRKMGRVKEAVEVYEKLFQLDPNRHFYSSYCNYKTNMPEAYQKAGEWQKADKMLHDDPELTDMASSLISCLWSKALSDYVVRNDRRFGDEYFCGGGSVTNCITAVIASPLVILFMTGRVPLPDIRIPYSYMSESKRSSIAHQANYARDNVELWKSIPGALEWADKTYNTIRCMRVVNPTMFEDIYDYYNEPGTYDTFIKYAEHKSGIFINAYTSIHSALIHDAVNYNNPKIVKWFIDHGADLKPKRIDLWPMHMACYYDRHPQIIEMLMDNGQNPTDPGKIGLSPLAMTANQGNWKAMYTIFKKNPELKKDKKLLAQLVDRLFNTSVYLCIRGGDKCQRCTNDKVPHSNDLSFEQCLKLLFCYGYRPTPKTRLPGPHTHFAPLLEALQSYDQTPPIETDDMKNTCPPAPKIGKTNKAPAVTAPPPSTVADTCAVCGKKEGSTKLKRCAACRSVKYCSTECQKRDWPSHKLKCQSNPKSKKLDDYSPMRYYIIYIVAIVVVCLIIRAIIGG